MKSRISSCFFLNWIEKLKYRVLACLVFAKQPRNRPIFTVVARHLRNEFCEKVIIITQLLL